MSGDAVIHLSQAGRRYGRRWAVRYVDLTVPSGEMIGIVGADGAGKTTLLQLCAAILDPSEGSCQVLGFDTVCDSKAVTSRIGYMSQGFTLYDRLSVEENLRFSARIRGIPSSVYDARRLRLLEMSGLGGFPNRLAGRLSGGMRKKLALCANLIHEPPLLILDEPSLGVDPLSRRELWAMLATFREQGITIMVATSYMDEADRCDRVLLLDEGAVLAADRPDGVRQSATGQVYERLTSNPTQAAAELERRPDVFGIQVLPDRLRFQLAVPADVIERSVSRLPGVREATPTLEDVFVRHASARIGNLAGIEVPEPLRLTGPVEADRVTVAFGTFRAVDQVSLAATPGTLVALLGPNGAGKTTLIRALCGLIPITSGEASIAGVSVTPGATRVRERIGYMSQRFSLYSDLSFRENLEFFAAAYGMKGNVAGNAIHWATAVTGLGESDARTLVADVSGAVRQRLALACSILHRPPVLFLDEPTSGVDPISRYRFWRLIRMLAGAGMVIVVTTHNLQEAEYCDRIGLMHVGRLIAIGSLGELRQRTGNEPGASVETVFVSAISQAASEAR